MKIKTILALTSFLGISTLTLTSCSNYVKDTKTAFLEITTSGGTAEVVDSFHGNNNYWEPKRSQYAVSNPVRLELEPDETATLRFYCPQCKYEDTVEVTEPYAHLFSCECDGKYKENDDMKEYISVEVAYTTTTNAQERP